MSNPVEREAEDNYEAENDPSPVEGNVIDNSYVRDTSSSMRNQVPVVRDQDSYDDPMRPYDANTDQQIADDEQEIVSRENARNNIMRGDRLRHAKPQTQNRYNEGREEDDLPRDIQYGTSGVSGTKRVT